MIARYLSASLNSLLDHYPAVALLGPRQVGKTTLALTLAAQRPALYLDLETDADRVKLSDAELYLADHEDRLVILDEVHRVPNLFQNLRGLIDRGRRRGRRTGRFLLLGSASMDLLRQSGETLAGRIAYLELTPLHALEIEPERHDRLGGSPTAFWPLTRRSVCAGDRISSAPIWSGTSPSWGRAFRRKRCAVSGPCWPTVRAGLNAAALARGLGVDGKTITHYLDLLVDLLLVRRLPAWHTNVGKRLIKSPKAYVRDSDLVHALLGLRGKEDVLGHQVVGASWEGFVIEMLGAVAPAGAEASFYRTANGAEIDLLLTLPGGQTWAVEIKRSLHPKPERGFHHACADLTPARAWVVYPGNERFPLGNGVETISLPDLAVALAAAGAT